MEIIPLNSRWRKCRDLNNNSVKNCFKANTRIKCLISSPYKISLLTTLTCMNNFRFHSVYSTQLLACLVLKTDAGPSCSIVSHSVRLEPLTFLPGPQLLFLGDRWEVFSRLCAVKRKEKRKENLTWPSLSLLRALRAQSITRMGLWLIVLLEDCTKTFGSIMRNVLCSRLRFIFSSDLSTTDIKNKGNSTGLRPVVLTGQIHFFKRGKQQWKMHGPSQFQISSAELFK